MGHTFESLPAFGRDVLEKLWDKDKSLFPYYSSILSEKLLSQYVQMAAPKNEILKKAAAAIEDSYFKHASALQHLQRASLSNALADGCTNRQHGRGRYRQFIDTHSQEGRQH